MGRLGSSYLDSYRLNHPSRYDSYYDSGRYRQKHYSDDDDVRKKHVRRELISIEILVVDSKNLDSHKKDRIEDILRNTSYFRDFGGRAYYTITSKIDENFDGEDRLVPLITQKTWINPLEMERHLAVVNFDVGEVYFCDLTREPSSFKEFEPISLKRKGDNILFRYNIVYYPNEAERRRPELKTYEIKTEGGKRK